MSCEALALTWCVELTLALLWFIRRLNARRDMMNETLPHQTPDQRRVLEQ